MTKRKLTLKQFIKEQLNALRNTGGDEETIDMLTKDTTLLEQQYAEYVEGEEWKY